MGNASSTGSHAAMASDVLWAVDSCSISPRSFSRETLPRALRQTFRSFPHSSCSSQPPVPFALASSLHCPAGLCIGYSHFLECFPLLFPGLALSCHYAQFEWQLLSSTLSKVGSRCNPPAHHSTYYKLSQFLCVFLIASMSRMKAWGSLP